MNWIEFLSKMAVFGINSCSFQKYTTSFIVGRKKFTSMKLLDQAWVLQEPWWRHCDPFVSAAWPGDSQSSQAACWWPPPAQLSGGFYCPSWSKRRWSKWKRRSSEMPDAWCFLYPECLDPTESPTLPRHQDHPELCVKVLTEF